MEAMERAAKTANIGNLIRKIGMQRFQLLSVRANETKKWSCFEIEALIKHYQGKVKELEKEKGIRL